MDFVLIIAVLCEIMNGLPCPGLYSDLKNHSRCYQPLFIIFFPYFKIKKEKKQ